MPARKRSLTLAVGAAGLLLWMPTPALAGEWSGLVEEVFVYLTTCITAIYALGVAIALFFKVFRTTSALYISFALSAISSLVFVLALLSEWRFLPLIRQHGNEEILHLLVANVFLLTFAWISPLIQFCLLRGKTPPVQGRTS